MAQSRLFLLMESAMGYSLFECTAPGGVIVDQRDVIDMARFSTFVKLIAFYPFSLPEDAFTGIKNISLGILGNDLKEFLTLNLPQQKNEKKTTYQVGVAETKIGAAIQEQFKILCVCDNQTEEIFRGIRLHLHKFLKIEQDDLFKSELALAHAYSRSQVKFDVNRTDNMVKQAVFLYDQIDKDINMLGMRVKEWFVGFLLVIFYKIKI
jgi:RNA processing factor Prp31